MRKVFFLLLAVACGGAAGGGAPVTAPAQTPSFEAPIVPLTPNELAPSQIRVSGGRPEDLVDVETCANCHTDVAAQWRTSSHAFASFNNPVYRASVERFRAVKDERTSRFCGGCHDPALIMATGMMGDVRAEDARAHAGITCRTCHGIAHARADGDASYDLDTSEIPLPKPNDDASLAQHKRHAAKSALRSASLCISCHRVYLDSSTGNAHHIPGQDDGTPWLRSAYAGSNAERIDDVEAKDCRGCHMQREEVVLGDAAAKNGTIASHRFLGAHTYLAAMRGDSDQLARVQKFLKTAATIDIAAMTRSPGGRVILPDGADVSPGDAVTFDVVVRNTGTGHRFPGGTLDAQDTWVEIEAATRRGRILARGGTDHAKTGADPSAHVLRAVLLDDGGQPVAMRETDKFRTMVTNHTIAPRDVEVVRYAMQVPVDLDADDFPLTVSARLVHRSRSLPVQKLTCDDAKSPKARAFSEAQRALYRITALSDRDLRPALDPCVVQPLTEIAAVSIEIGEGAHARSRGDAFDRAYALGLGLTHALQERLDEARGPLMLAHEAARTPKERAMVEGALAALAARQGRVEETIAWTANAERIFPDHPSLARSRGEVLAMVWRFDAALPDLWKAARQAPRDDALWSRLAVSLGSDGKMKEALEVARVGLAAQPRDPDCLRVQALALEALGAPAADVDVAKRAYFDRRTPDDAPRLKAMCSAKVPGCALERDPVHVHMMHE